MAMTPKKKSLIPSHGAKLLPWQKWQPTLILPLEKGSRAGVVVDKNGSPQLFVFDTHALLDILSTIDEALSDRLSAEDYQSKEANPSGWLIDEIEAHLPVSEEYVQSLKNAIAEAEEKGWIPFEQIKKELQTL